jgi:hypothetical protein
MLVLLHNCAEKLPDVKRRACLKKVLTDLFLLHEGAVILPGLVIFVPGGIVPVPQTNPLILALNMASPGDDWRATLTNEILLYLEKAHSSGHAQAVPDADDWCRKYDLDVPRWLRDAPRNVSRRGERSPETQRKLFETDYFRFVLVEAQAAFIRTEKKKPGYRKDALTGNDKFARAKALLRGLWADTPNKGATEDTGAVKDSHKRFKHRRHTYYLAPAFLMDILKKQAPSVFEILS